MALPASVCSVMCCVLWRSSERQGSSKKTREERQDGMEHAHGRRRTGWLMIDRCSRSAAVVGSQAQRRMHTTATAPRTLDFLGQWAARRRGIGKRLAARQARHSNPADRATRAQVSRDPPPSVGRRWLRGLRLAACFCLGSRSLFPCRARPLPCHAAMPCHAVDDGRGGVGGWKRRNCLAWTRRGPQSLFRRLPCLGRGLRWCALPSGHWVAGHVGRVGRVNYPITFP